MKPKQSMVKYGVEDCGGTQRWTWDGKLIARVIHRIKTLIQKELILLTLITRVWFELFDE